MAECPCSWYRRQWRQSRIPLSHSTHPRGSAMSKERRYTIEELQQLGFKTQGDLVAAGKRLREVKHG